MSDITPAFFFVRQKVLAGEPPDASYAGSWDTHMARQKYWGACQGTMVKMWVEWVDPAQRRRH